MSADGGPTANRSDRLNSSHGNSINSVSILSHCARDIRIDSALFRAKVESIADWDLLIATADHHGMTPLLIAAISQSCPDAIPSPVESRLREAQREAIAKYMFHSRELARLLALLGNKKIFALPLKGPILAQLLYPDSSLRPSSDLDLLVHLQDVHRTLHIFESNGFAAEHFLARVPLQKLLRLKSEILLSNQRGLMIDLHWEITPSDFPFRINPAVLWDSVRSVEFEGTEVPALAPEALMVFLCVHGTKHAWSRLIWLADVARLTQTDLNWEEAFALATRIGCERPLLLGLLLAGEVLGAAVPSVYIDRARTQRIVVSLADQVKRRLSSDIFAEPTGLELTIFNTRLAERWWDKVRHFTALLKAPTETELELLSLPPKLFVLYYPFRIYRLMVKYTARLFMRA